MAEQRLVELDAALTAARATAQTADTRARAADAEVERIRSGLASTVARVQVRLTPFSKHAHAYFQSLIRLTTPTLFFVPFGYIPRPNHTYPSSTLFLRRPPHLGTSRTTKR